MTATFAIPLDAAHVDAAGCLRDRLGAPRDAPPAIFHVSLLVVLKPQDDGALSDAADRVAARLPAFSVRARDLGVFLDGEASPVLHVPVVRSSALARLHRLLFDELADRGFEIEGRSHPDAWIPHVTIWRDGLTPDLLGAAIRRYASGEPVAWNMRASRLGCLDERGWTSDRRLGVSRCQA